MSGTIPRRPWTERGAEVANAGHEVSKDRPEHAGSDHDGGGGFIGAGADATADRSPEGPSIEGRSAEACTTEGELAAGRSMTGIAAFESVFNACSTAFYRFFAVRTGDRHHADDLMQQLWMHARPRGVSIAEGEIEFWLRSVARNLLATFWRKRLRRGRVQADAGAAGELARRLATEELPAAELERREYRDLLLLAITELAAAEQELILGCYYEGLSHAALAARLGVSERAIEGRLYRARQTLREKLQSLE